MRHPKLAWFCFFASIGAVWLSLRGRDDIEPPRPKPYIPIACSVSFQAYSNSPSGRTWAVLLVTNLDSGDLSFVGPYGLSLSNRPSCHVEARWQLAPTFAPGTGTRIAVEIPPGSGTWRAGFFLIRTTWRDYVRNLRVLDWCPDRLLPRSTYQVDPVETDWVPR
jgi:hypothetical protein